MPLTSNAGMPFLGASKQMDTVKKLTTGTKATNVQELACWLLSYGRETHTKSHAEESSSRDKHTHPAVPTAPSSPS